MMLGFAVTPRKQREDRARTGEILDRVDGWIAERVLGGEQFPLRRLRGGAETGPRDDIVALWPELRRRPLCELA